MEIGGVALLTVVVLLCAVIPRVIQRRDAILHSREGDRFSPGLRIVRPLYENQCAARQVQRLISQETHIHHYEGVKMGAEAVDRGPSAVHTPGAKARAQELAQLRAQRVARRSVELAAAQRRMVGAGIFLGLVVVLSVLAFISVLPWWSVLLPTCGLGGVLFASQRSAGRSARADEAERCRLAELKAPLRGGSSGDIVEQAARVGHEAVVVEDQKIFEQVQDTVSAEQFQAEDVQAVEEVHVTENTAEFGVMEDTESLPASDEPEARKTWTPVELPAPRYSRGSRIEGRVVHADTDLRGIPRVKAAVPARPVEATITDEESFSSDEVAARAPLAFNLDQVLEARRA